MMTQDPCLWSATEIEARILRRRTTVETVCRALLARIRQSEPDVGAFEALDPAYLLAQAAQLDRVALKGPLHGIPIAVSDVIETREYPTTWGSALYRGVRTRRDAGAVALARRSGAIIMGKTVVTEFATAAPGKTSNPYDLDHTPGGASSGAAAAVAERMVPLAFAMQSGASVIRPASFCGVIGYKASWGAFDLGGFMSLSRWLDSFGLFCRDLRDISLVRGVLSGSDRIRRPRPPAEPPRVALYHSPDWDRASSDMQRLVDTTAQRLAAAGARVVTLKPPESFTALTEVHREIVAWDIALGRVGEEERAPDRVSGQFRGVMRLGRSIGLARYERALALAEKARSVMGRLMEEVDVILTPAATGEAPAGRIATGDPVFGRIFTLLHMPAIALPAGFGPRNLPMAVQLVGAVGRDDRLVSDALWIDQVLHPVPEEADKALWDVHRD